MVDSFLQPEYTVEIQRNRGGTTDDESAAFYTIEEARDWASVMLQQYGWRKAWINGTQYTGKEITR